VSAPARRRDPRVHPLRCQCSHCDPVAAAERRAANRFARIVFTGLALGLSVAWCLDKLIGGPGVLSIFLGAPQ